MYKGMKQMLNTINLINKEMKQLDDLQKKKKLVIDKAKNLIDRLDNHEKMEIHIDKLKELIKKPAVEQKEELIEQKNVLENKVKNVNKKEILTNLNEAKKEKVEINKQVKDYIHKLKLSKKKLGKENLKIKEEIKNYNQLKEHEKKLTKKINELENKKMRSNIVDTDKDGVNDKSELRSDDGQLRTNPDKGDIKKESLEELKEKEQKLTKDIDKLKKQRKKVRKKIAKTKIDNLRETSKALGLKTLALGNVITKGETQVLGISGNDELEKSVRVMS
jgi:chromosome segregation ATPase